MTQRIAVDTGGTFTDCILFDDENNRIEIAKIPSEPANPHAPIIKGIEELVGLDAAGLDALDSVSHGTTIATNALITGDLAKVGMVTTKGFRDVLEIGTQMRPKLYDLHQTKRPQLVPRELRAEVAGRVAADGSELEPFDRDEIIAAVDALVESGVESIAIGFLFSFLHPEWEQVVEEIVRERHPEVYAGASSRLSREPREFSRFSTAAVNASLAPRVAPYIAALNDWLNDRLGDTRLFLMHSNGGLSPAERSADEGAHQLILSGPAAAVIGGARESGDAGYPNCVTFDIGGTSADIALIRDGQPGMAIRMDLPNGLPCDLPHTEIKTIGAGGGSIASLDAGRALSVGPKSAGAHPGPACYGRGGTHPTVTDAQLVLGHLSPGGLVGGNLQLDRDLAEKALESIAVPLGLTTEDAALAVLAVVQENMGGALQGAAASHGDDLRDFALVAGGGGGPMHAVFVARSLTMPAVIIPERPGLLSAKGLLGADTRHDASVSLLGLEDEPTLEDVWRTLDELVARLDAALEREGVATESRHFEHNVDIRYVGQEHSLRVPVLEREEDLAALFDRFHAAHERTYGHSSATAPVEPVAARVVARGLREPAGTAANEAVDHAVPHEHRAVLFDRDEGRQDTPVYRREEIADGQVIEGPAIIEQFDTTTVIPPGWSADSHPSGSIVITPADGERSAI
jgi:N-methylhydantoinase A